MAKQRKDSIKVSYALDRAVAERLDDFCMTTGRTKTKVIEIALQEYIDQHETEMKKRK